MPTKEYEKAEQELQRLINLNKLLSDNNTKLLEGREVLNELAKHLEGAITTNIPLCQEYIKDLIAVRMTFAREVADIVRTATELKGITKTAKELFELGEAIINLNRILTPEVVEKIKRISNG